VEKQLALIADSANISVEGKLNVLGEFDTIWAAAEPATHPALWFVAKLLFGASDAGKHNLLLRLVDDDGNTVLAPLTGLLEIQAPGAGYSGDGPSIPVILCAQNITLPRFGTYTFELRVDERIVAEVPLHVRKLQTVAPEG
jgi:hypothetical protein